ncbi:hypothetical protein Tco_0841448 [Tanacetum coccineum]|uniref:Uncharacterized protein n=1 Tax=Tanacetum coccineum TaxID=301880 RepID=A0ABQ5AXE2_9ASTR
MVESQFGAIKIRAYRKFIPLTFGKALMHSLEKMIGVFFLEKTSHWSDILEKSSMNLTMANDTPLEMCPVLDKPERHAMVANVPFFLALFIKSSLMEMELMLYELSNQQEKHLASDFDTETESEQQGGFERPSVVSVIAGASCPLSTSVSMITVFGPWMVTTCPLRV